MLTITSMSKKKKNNILLSMHKTKKNTLCIYISQELIRNALIKYSL